MEAFVEKELCVFVGGSGIKAGVVQAGGCTKEWLLGKGCDPSSLFGPDGGCVYQGIDLAMDGDGVVSGAAGQFEGVEPGMVAFSDGDIFQTYYEVKAVGANFESITLGYDMGMEDTVDLYIGGAFSSLQQAFFCSTAYHRNCWVFTNKDEVLTATANLTYNGGDPLKNTWKRAMGYSQTISYANGVFISDMDEGQAFYRSAEKIMQEGIGSDSKVVLDGSALAAAAVNFQRDNMELRNIYVIGSAGYDCMRSEGGYTGHSHGLVLKGCAFDGGLNGFNGIDGCDGVVLDDCWAGPGINGWGFRVQDSALAAKSVHLSRCVADGCGSGYNFNVPVVLDGCLGRNLAVGVRGDGDTKIAGCVLYNMTGAAFELNSDKARLAVWNTIAVMNESAPYGVFHVMASGGSIVYEDYNCFIDRLGGGSVLYYSGDWPASYSARPVGGHTLQQSPVMINAVGGDYELEDVSPCVDAGKPDLCGNVTHIGFYEKPDAPSGGGGGNNSQYRNNRQYGVGRNKQYG